MSREVPNQVCQTCRRTVHTYCNTKFAAGCANYKKRKKYF